MTAPRVTPALQCLVVAELGRRGLAPAVLTDNRLADMFQMCKHSARKPNRCPDGSAARSPDSGPAAKRKALWVLRRQRNHSASFVPTCRIATPQSLSCARRVEAGGFMDFLHDPEDTALGVRHSGGVSIHAVGSGCRDCTRPDRGHAVSR
jgi:hypothetical protein